jgi:hypothetical protein
MSQLLESAQTFVLSNARLLERHLTIFTFITPTMKPGMFWKGL